MLKTSQELIAAFERLRQILPTLRAHVEAHFGGVHRPLPEKGQVVRDIEGALDRALKLFQHGKVAEAERNLEHVAATLRGIVAVELMGYREHQRGTRPTWSEARVAQALNQLGTVLIRLCVVQGARRAEEEALRSAVEANEIYLDRLRPDVPEKLQDVALAADFLREHLNRLGRPAEALEVAAAVVSLLRFVSEIKPDHAHLANALKALIDQYAQVPTKEGLVPYLHAHVQVTRHLATHGRPAQWQPELADALARLGKHLMAIHLPREAVAPFTEEITIRRILAARDPATHENALSVAMFHLSTAWLSVGGIDEAADVMRAIIGDLRESPARRATLAMYVADLGLLLIDLRTEQALEPCREAVDLYRTLAATDRPTWLPTLTKALLQLTRCLTLLQRWPEASTTSEEALGLWPDCDPPPEDEELSHALLKRVEIQLALDEPEGALTTLARAGEATDDGALRAEIVYHQSRILTLLERPTEQRAALVQAIELYWAFVREDRGSDGDIDRVKALLSEYLAAEPEPALHLQALAEALEVN